jgi:hypothetical protein
VSYTQQFVPEIVSIAEASLGGLRGRSALLIGPEARWLPYSEQLREAGILRVYTEPSAQNLVALIPRVQLVMNLPDLPSQNAPGTFPMPTLSAADIARGCAGRRAPLVILDLAETPSVEELAGLLPAVCLYTPDDLRKILGRLQVQIA